MTPLTLILSDYEHGGCCLESSEIILDKLIYEVHFAKFPTSGMEENKGNPNSGEADRLLGAELLSTFLDRK